MTHVMCNPWKKTFTLAPLLFWLCFHLKMFGDKYMFGEEWFYPTQSNTMGKKNYENFVSALCLQTSFEWNVPKISAYISRMCFSLTITLD